MPVSSYATITLCRTVMALSQSARSQNRKTLDNTTISFTLHMFTRLRKTTSAAVVPLHCVVRAAFVDEPTVDSAVIAHTICDNKNTWMAGTLAISPPHRSRRRIAATIHTPSTPSVQRHRCCDLEGRSQSAHCEPGSCRPSHSREQTTATHWTREYRLPAEMRSPTRPSLHTPHPSRVESVEAAPHYQRQPETCTRERR